MKLFKYVSRNRIDILENKKIRFTQPSAWNDPFEMKQAPLQIKEYDYTGLLDQRDIAFMNTLQNDLNFLGLSLTENDRSIIMWAHYADNHAGFMLEFDTTSSFFDEHESNKLVKIPYSNTRPTLDSFSFYDNFIKDIEFRKKNFSNALVKLFTKSIDWEHEKEWRLIRPSAALEVKNGEVFDKWSDVKYMLNQIYTYISHGKGLPIDEYYFGRLKEDAITGIYLGVRTDETKKNEIINLINNDKTLSHIKLYQAFLNDYKYEIEYKDITASTT